MKLSEFWKKYKLYIYIGVIVGLVLGLMFYLFYDKNDNTKETILPIDSPFQYEDATVAFSGYTDDLDIATSLEIYSTTEPDIEIIKNFVSRFSDKDSSVTDDIYLWSFSGATITYTEGTSLLFLTSPKGLVTDIKISSKSDVTSFLLDYFNIRDIEISNVTILDDNKKEYYGYYTSDTLQYGSLYIDGYALDMVTDNSKIYSLSILMLGNGNVVHYQNMPTVALSGILNNNHEIYIKYISYDDNFTEQYPLLQASADLKEVDVKEASYKYVFINREYEYIIPIYELSGDGSLIDSQNNEYWANVSIYMSALDSEYLNTVEPYLENNILLDAGE